MSSYDSNSYEATDFSIYHYDFYDVLPDSFKEVLKITLAVTTAVSYSLGV